MSSEIERIGKKAGARIAGKLKQVIDENTRKATKVVEREGKKIQTKTERIRELRKEASRMASMANKRVKRLEKNDLKDTPAYQGYLRSGGGKFSVRGKDYNELQAEMARMRAFINANTSTVRGAHQTLKDIADNTGIKYKNLKQLKKQSEVFFEIASKIEQNLSSIDGLATALGYQKIWEQINVYVKENKIDLANAKQNVDIIVDKISQAIKEYETPAFLDFTQLGGGTHWYKLPKE